MALAHGARPRRPRALGPSPSRSAPGVPINSIRVCAVFPRALRCAAEQSRAEPRMRRIARGSACTEPSACDSLSRGRRKRSYACTRGCIVRCYGARRCSTVLIGPAGARRLWPLRVLGEYSASAAVGAQTRPDCAASDRHVVCCAPQTMVLGSALTDVAKSLVTVAFHNPLAALTANDYVSTAKQSGIAARSSPAGIASLHHAPCTMQHAPVQHAPCNMHFATCTMRASRVSEYTRLAGGRSGC